MSIFLKYYADPEYKKRHLAHMYTKINCPDCGHLTSRSNMSKHRKSRNCKSPDQKNQEQKQMQKEILKLKQELKKERENNALFNDIIKSNSNFLPAFDFSNDLNLIN